MLASLWRPSASLLLASLWRPSASSVVKCPSASSVFPVPRWRCGAPVRGMSRRNWPHGAIQIATDACGPGRRKVAYGMFRSLSCLLVLLTGWCPCWAWPCKIVGVLLLKLLLASLSGLACVLFALQPAGVLVGPGLVLMCLICRPCLLKLFAVPVLGP